jgi:uncharacterized protein (TIGR03437 family)
MTPLCLLAGLCAAPLWLAAAQSGQRPEENIPGVPAGYTIIEGDIQMPIVPLRSLRGLAPEAAYYAGLWYNGIIPFRFEPTCAATSNCAGAPASGCVSVANQTAMLNAIAVLEAVANVDFRQCANNNCGRSNHILIRDSTNDTTAGPGNTCQNASANNSPVGVQGGQQIINIVSWGTQFIIVHELLHSLGLFHEQSRPDRDPYVDVASLCNNVQGGCMGNTYLINFPIDPQATAYGYYDFDSVMHYGQCSFSRNPNCPTTDMTFPDGGITVRVKPPYNAQLSPDGVPWQDLVSGRSAIGQRIRLSELDRLTLSFLYPRPNWRFVDGTSRAGPANGTFLLPYMSLQVGINATPAGGVLWIQPGSYRAPSTIAKNITLRAPLGGVTLLPPLQGAAGETLASVSAASYNGELASESIAAAFGESLADGTVSATSLPLPTTLGGVTVKVKDSEETERDAPLFFVSPGQINYLVPAGLSAGIANVSVFKGTARAANTTIPITATAPALFTANASGQGVPAAVVLRVRGEAQTIEPLARYDEGLKQFVPVPIDLGPEGDQVFLILFGTGFRAANSSEAISMTIGGESAEVFFVGATPGLAGLDQANVLLPRSLAGKGEVRVEFVADNRSANDVIVSVR